MAEHHSDDKAGGYAKALEIRTSQGWKLTGEAIPILYTDTINDQQVCRDDVWLCTTTALRKEDDKAGGEVVAYLETITGRLCVPEYDHRRKFPMCYQALYTRPQPQADVVSIASEMQIAIANGYLPDQCEAADDWLVKMFGAGANPQSDARPEETAKQKYERLEVAKENMSPIENLRAFCSFAMNGIDWLDVEPLFDALGKRPAERKSLTNEQIDAIVKPIFPHAQARIYTPIVRAIEAAHGITGKDQS